MIQTEYVYVYVKEENPSGSESDFSSEQSGWILKEYNGQIGVFLPDGTMLRLIDTYVKTLPKADQIMLEEGIYAMTEQELRSLIEDYSD